jgi:hypothetical protein
VGCAYSTDTWTEGWFLGRRKWDDERFYHATQKDVQLETCELFISAVFYQVSETTEGKIADKEDECRVRLKLSCTW